MALAIGSVGYISLDTANKNTFSLLRQSTQLALGGFVDKVDVHLRVADIQTQALSELLGRSPEFLGDDDRLASLLTGALYSNEHLTGLAVVRADGSLVAIGKQRNGAPGYLDDVTALGPGFDAFVEVVAARAPQTQYALAYQPVLEVPIAAVGRAVMREGEVVAVVAVPVSLVSLSEFLGSSDQVLEVTGFILSGETEVIAHRALADIKLNLTEENPLPHLRDIPDPILQQMWGPRESFDSGLLDGTEIEGHQISFGGDLHYFLYSRYDGFTPDKPVIIGFHIPKSETINAMDNLVNASILALSISVFAVVLIFFAGRGVAWPIRRLGGASEAVAELRIEDAPRLGRSTFQEVDSANQAFNSMVSALRRFETYVPRRLVRRMLELEREGQATGSEEREITVLFTDIVSFTELAHDMPASQLAELLNTHFGLLAGPIEQEDGTIDKYIGDSVMAFWGAPEAQEDHARRAIRAVREIARALSEDNKARVGRGEAPIQIRAGLHCGSVIVGDIGAPGRINYTAVGDAVNTAQRLETVGKSLGFSGDVTVTLSAALVKQAKLDRKPIAGVSVTLIGPLELRGVSGAFDCYRLDIEL